MKAEMNGRAVVRVAGDSAGSGTATGMASRTAIRNSNLRNSVNNISKDRIQTTTASSSRVVAVATIAGAGRKWTTPPAGRSVR